MHMLIVDLNHFVYNYNYDIKYLYVAKYKI